MWLEQCGPSSAWEFWGLLKIYLHPSCLMRHLLRFCGNRNGHWNQVVHFPFQNAVCYLFFIRMLWLRWFDWLDSWPPFKWSHLSRATGDTAYDRIILSAIFLRSSPLSTDCLDSVRYFHTDNIPEHELLTSVCLEPWSTMSVRSSH